MRAVQTVRWGRPCVPPLRLRVTARSNPHAAAPERRPGGTMLRGARKARGQMSGAPLHGPISACIGACSKPVCYTGPAARPRVTDLLRVMVVFDASRSTGALPAAPPVARGRRAERPLAELLAGRAALEEMRHARPRRWRAARALKPEPACELGTLCEDAAEPGHSGLNPGTVNAQVLQGQGKCCSNRQQLSGNPGRLARCELRPAAG
jgi:hypothetical protein